MHPYWSGINYMRLSRLLFQFWILVRCLLAKTLGPYISKVLTDHEIRNASDRNYIHQLLKMCNIQIIRNLFHILSVSLDLDQSRSEGILTIRNGFDQDLDRLR